MLNIGHYTREKISDELIGKAITTYNSHYDNTLFGAKVNSSVRKTARDLGMSQNLVYQILKDYRGKGEDVRGIKLRDKAKKTFEGEIAYNLGYYQVGRDEVSKIEQVLSGIRDRYHASDAEVGKGVNKFYDSQGDNEKVVYIGGQQNPNSLCANPKYRVVPSNVRGSQSGGDKLRSLAGRVAAAVLAFGLVTSIPQNPLQGDNTVSDVTYKISGPVENSSGATIDDAVGVNSNITGLDFNQLPNNEDLASKLRLNKINYLDLPSDVAKQWFSFWIESNLDRNSLQLTPRFNPKAPDIQNMNVYMFIDPAKVTVIGTPNYRWLDNPNGGKILELSQGAPVYISLSDAEKSAFENWRRIPDTAGGYIIDGNVLKIVTSVNRLEGIKPTVPEPEVVEEEVPTVETPPPPQPTLTLPIISQVGGAIKFNGAIK